jgi:hypothetical protein
MAMLDDLREQASEPDFFGEEDLPASYVDELETRPSPQLFLGMTPVQRFVIAIMILLMACVMGTFLLLVTEKVYFPFV